MSVLIAYSTSRGSTTAIAERIAERLKAYASTVDCLPIAKVSAASLPNYSAVIIGSAVHFFEWLGPARRFVSDNAAVLKTRPVWAFSVGFPAGQSELKEQEYALGEKVKQDVPDLLAHKFFYGRWRKEDAGLGWRLFLRILAPEYLKRWGDDRNWGEIDAWADLVGEKLSNAQNASVAP